MRWLRLEIWATMASYGGPTIDAFGKTNDMPGRSMLTGLIANALGWERSDYEKHQQLQNHLVYGTAQEDDPNAGRLTDYQTALLKKDDVAWTTSGRPAKRTSNAATFSGSHQRWRDYHTDIRMTVVMTLIPATKRPSLTEIAEAIDRPARTLFIGRGSCLPKPPHPGGNRRGVDRARRTQEGRERDQERRDRPLPRRRRRAPGRTATD